MRSALGTRRRKLPMHSQQGAAFYCHWVRIHGGTPVTTLTLLAVVERTLKAIPRSHEPQSARGDPILKDLLKLNPHTSLVVAASAPHGALSVNHYSFKLLEVLALLNDEPHLDDSQRMGIEATLFELTSYIPRPADVDLPNAFLHQPPAFYPNEQLSKVLIDNFAHMLRFLSSYFNLSLASHVTKYMVELVYALQYWEIYHLLYLLPNLEHFLKLCDIEVIQTPFGPLVKPPANYLEPSMAQGFDYPFPYPFYNYSYHAIEEKDEIKKRKLSRIHITPYIDITLKNVDQPARRKPATTRTYTKRVGRPKSSVPQTVKSAVSLPAATQPDSDIEPDKLTVSVYNNSTDSSDSDDEDGKRARADGMEVGELDEDAKSSARNKSGVIHQCHLMDPNLHQPCLKIFYGKNELLRHQEFVHATKKKIYKCIYCTRNGTKVLSYPRHDSLARHIRRKHGITGKENKMAVNFAKENVEIIDDPGKLAEAQAHALHEEHEHAQAQKDKKFLAKVQQFQPPLLYSQPLVLQLQLLPHASLPPSTAEYNSVGSTATADTQVASLDPKPHQHLNFTFSVKPILPPNAASASSVNALPPVNASSSHTTPMVPSVSTFKQQSLPPPLQPLPRLSLSSSFRGSDYESPLPDRVDRVNFNKPEGSALKENFQKFRLANSPASIKNGTVANVTPNTKPAYGEESGRNRLPGIGMYLNQDWGTRRELTGAPPHGFPLLLQPQSQPPIPPPIQIRNLAPLQPLHSLGFQVLPQEYPPRSAPPFVPPKPPGQPALSLPLLVRLQPQLQQPPPQQLPIPRQTLVSQGTGYHIIPLHPQPPP